MSFVVSALVVLLYVLAWMTLVVFVSRRLFGRPVSATRAVLAGAVALAAFSAAALVAGTGSDYQWAFFTLQVGLSVLAALAFLVIAEAVVPPGSGMGVVRWRRAWRRRVGRSRRYVEIASIASRHGLLPFTRRQRRALVDPGGRRALARSLRDALEEGGVAFVKLGQLLSTRSDLLPPEFVDELTTLQDRVTPEPWAAVESVLAEELGAAWHEVFAHIEHEPLAAASIAQVHAAVLSSGESVVVKVQRPGIRHLIERDLDIVDRIAHSLEGRSRSARRIGAVDLARGFARAMHEELDFRVEARNIIGVAAAAARRRDSSVHATTVGTALQRASARHGTPGWRLARRRRQPHRGAQPRL
ncbi:MAG TPA: AarF/UbiB family protein [Acidimicrobiales bacterium]|nr:AarF/UbiB family protein [Acidimicrobiales bacterium]